MSEEIFAFVIGVFALVATLFVVAASAYVSLKVTGWIHNQRISNQEDK